MIFSENRYPLFGIMLHELLCGRVTLAADPGADFALGLRSGKAVAFLQPRGELVAAAVDAGDVFVGELGPVVPQPVFEVQPVALDLIPGHRDLPCHQWKRSTRRRASAARDVNGAMRPEFDHNAVFPRRMLALLWRASIVNSERRYSRHCRFLTAGVVAIR